MVDAARAGGEVALAHFRRGTEATRKPDGSPVTEADREAEEVIARTLGAAFPEQDQHGDHPQADGRDAQTAGGHGRPDRRRRRP